MPNDFNHFGLKSELISSLEQLNRTTPTPVQKAALPAVLNGDDVRAKAKTGSGKTMAFALGALQRLDTKQFRPQTLVLCPTRELAQQVAEETRKLAAALPNVKVLTLCGGMPIGPQIGSLEHGAHIVVGTPGRIGDLIRKGKLHLNKVRQWVLDEADRMLDMGFQDQIEEIHAELPKHICTWLFSATYPAEIEDMSARYQRNPVTVEIETIADLNPNITHYLAPIDDAQTQLPALISHYSKQAAVVFVATRDRVSKVREWLYNAGFTVLSLEGGMEQKQRTETLARFSNGSTHVLVATDVAARGLDVDVIDLVINLDPPMDRDTMTHRNGRTGRAGRSGTAIHCFTERSQTKVEAYAPNDSSLISTDDLDFYTPDKPPFVTIAIAGGKKNKVRKGDILGALTAGAGINGSQIGSIQIEPFQSYVAIDRETARKAMSFLETNKIKGRFFKVRRF